MAVIYLDHPKHGSKVACAEDEAKYDETKGWVRRSVAALLKPSPEPVKPVIAQPDLEMLRAQYAVKFGSKPHHKKSVETLRRELAA